MSSFGSAAQCLGHKVCPIFGVEPWQKTSKERGHEGGRATTDSSNMLLNEVELFRGFAKNGFRRGSGRARGGERLVPARAPGPGKA
ncbi:hypothetical protein AK812_SmicGene27024 [Symbiodinium microadriaticum]|uniref:Uncharacterized protein n=1 Tax=Symbiodinium microadriaticum TaxID=2951 RepID=A0A1Q9D7Y0_SYMMI|nr:hypothetical protein AK812_SmicGene27024 [Symbiodinium microadriaticum]